MSGGWMGRVAAIGLLCMSLTAPLSAQIPTGAFRPAAEWRTVELERLVVHFPAEAEGWVMPLLERMEAMEEAVAAAVGHRPGRRARVIVTDPLNLSNGVALNVMDRPITMLWPTPPGPRAGLGTDWGQLLFVHEYAHLAHLTRPTRNPLRGWLGRLSPLQIGPLPLVMPRWVTEGYATVLEGSLTGGGRPYSPVRAAFLRARALDGRLPTYRELSGASGFQDMASPYLAGSAYLEWLVEREGPESLQHLWLRLSARERRGFDEGFRGVFGAPPAELYGRFTVEKTARALEAREMLTGAGLHEGELVLRRRWHAGSPALSPDGLLLALELHSPEGPPRIVVLETTPDEEALERRAEARERLLERDSLDVPAIDRDPDPLKRVATLEAAGGRPWLEPRFLPDGRRILTVRWEPLGDGTQRPDLFVWHHESGRVERITRGAGIRQADPSPDGERAVGVRCEWGSCGLVLVELATGGVTSLVEGASDVVYHAPVWAPDGGSVVAARQTGGRWRIVRVALDGSGVVETLDPDDGADRYEPAFFGESGELVVVSDLGGVPNLERLDPSSASVRPLTRVLGATGAPSVHGDEGWVYFLDLHSRGWDLRRIHGDSVVAGEVVHLPPGVRSIPAEGPAMTADGFERRPVPPAREYGWGPQRALVLPVGGIDALGGSYGAALYLSDPVGRASTVLQGMVGDAEGWSGISLGTRLRRIPGVAVEAGGFRARQRRTGAPEGPTVGAVDLTGGVLAVAREIDLDDRRLGFRAGGSAGRARVARAVAGDIDGTERVNRYLGFAGVEGRADLAAGGVRLVPELRTHLASGRTGTESWTRLRLDGGIVVGGGPAGIGTPTGLALEATYGRLDGTAQFEAFRVGGRPDGLVDPAVMSQHIALPGLPPALLRGRRILTARAAFRTGGIEPFIRIVDMEPLGRGRHRIIGLEERTRLDATPLPGLPGLDLHLGVSHSLDDPFGEKTRGWLSVGLRP